MLTNTQIAYQTQFTKTGKRNMLNRKPFRRPKQKRLARQKAIKCKDGAYRSNAPVSYH